MQAGFDPASDLDKQTVMILYGDGPPAPIGVIEALKIKGERGEVTEKNPHGMNRKARRKQAAEDRRAFRRIMKAANLFATYRKRQQ